MPAVWRRDKLVEQETVCCFSLKYWSGVQQLEINSCCLDRDKLVEQETVCCFSLKYWSGVHCAKYSYSRSCLYQKTVVRSRCSTWQTYSFFMENNQGTIALAQNPVFHSRTKHIDIRRRYVRSHSEECHQFTILSHQEHDCWCSDESCGKDSVSETDKTHGTCEHLGWQNTINRN